MKITRRAALGTLLAAPALAQDWPTRPVRCIIPYPPGGPTDLVGRVIAQRAQQELGQPLVPENKPGASGTIGAAEVARATPDGQVFLMNWQSEDSLDGRYFGLLSRTTIVGRADPLWTQEDE